MSEDALTSVEKRSGSGQFSRRYRSVALGILAIGFIFSLFIWSFTSQAIHNTEQARFDHYAKMVKELISSQFHEYIAAVRGTRAFVESSEQVTREEWQRYTDNFNADPHFENIYNFALIRLVPRKHLAEFLAEIRDVNTSGSEVSPTGNQDDLFIVEFTQAYSESSMQPGQDLGDDPLL
ncbi:MAG TPA: CHASE domain-containing protein, partial [Fibrobacteraceae bacterium]|nr:CHASE domain-containing protein [Fibrobacteraceae bacterium]